MRTTDTFLCPESQTLIYCQSRFMDTGYPRTAYFHCHNYVIINNYSPKWRWLAVDIYRVAKGRGKYQPLATDTEVNSCFSIY